MISASESSGVCFVVVFGGGGIISSAPNYNFALRRFRKEEKKPSNVASNAYSPSATELSHNKRTRTSPTNVGVKVLTAIEMPFGSHSPSPFSSSVLSDELMRGVGRKVRKGGRLRGTTWNHVELQGPLLGGQCGVLYRSLPCRLRRSTARLHRFFTQYNFSL
ncbi:hypothetical protein VTK56DRAFT_146 [Thermocarpiscus australiensis]